MFVEVENVMTVSQGSTIWLTSLPGAGRSINDYHGHQSLAPITTQSNG